MASKKYYYTHFNCGDPWYGYTSFHKTAMSANLLYRAYMTMELVGSNMTSPRVAELEALSDEDLYELFEQECDGMGFEEDIELLDLKTIQDAYNAL